MATKKKGTGALLGPAPLGNGFLTNWGITDPGAVMDPSAYLPSPHQQSLQGGSLTLPPQDQALAPLDTGGGAAAEPAPPPPELATSPEWLAYLNALGLEENQFRADIDRQRGLVNSESARQAGLIAPQYALGRQRIAAGQESRGVYRSGQTQTRLGETRRQEGVAQGNVAAEQAQQLSGLESALAQRLIDLGTRKSQEELSLRQRGYV